VRHLFNFTDVRGIDIPHNRLTPTPPTSAAASKQFISCHDIT